MARFYWHPHKREWLPIPPRKPAPRIHVISDVIDPTWAMCGGGGMFDSKSQYYSHVKNNGCEIVGNDRDFVKDKEYTPAPGLEDDLRAAIEEVGI